MKKIVSFAFLLSLVFSVTACGQNVQTETDAAGNIETSKAAERAQESEEAAPAESSATDTEEEAIVKAEFDFEAKTVMLSSGVRLIDTASAYGNEEEIGQAIREAINEEIIQREDIFVITKIYPGSEMEKPEQSIQACLDRLNIGYVDMMLLHHPDDNDVKAYKAMEQFVADGKIRSIGLSNWYVEELTEFLPQVDTVPALVQNEIHPYYQENDVIPFIRDFGIVVQGWYPLGGRGHTAELLGDPVISEIAKAHDVSSAQVILRWNLQKGVVVIPGSSNPDHFFMPQNMFIVGSSYWPMAYGQMPGDVRSDGEGLETIRNLGRNMAYLLKALDERRR